MQKANEIPISIVVSKMPVLNIAEKSVGIEEDISVQKQKERKDFQERKNRYIRKSLELDYLGRKESVKSKSVRIESIENEVVENNPNTDFLVNGFSGSKISRLLPSNSISLSKKSRDEGSSTLGIERTIVFMLTDKNPQSKLQLVRVSLGKEQMSEVLSTALEIERGLGALSGYVEKGIGGVFKYQLNLHSNGEKKLHCFPKNTVPCDQDKIFELVKRMFEKSNLINATGQMYGLSVHMLVYLKNSQNSEIMDGALSKIMKVESSKNGKGLDYKFNLLPLLEGLFGLMSSK